MTAVAPAHVPAPPSLSVTLTSYGPTLAQAEGVAQLLEQARQAEAAGVDRLLLTDHVLMGEHTDRYPWGPFPFPPDTPWLEPLTLIAALAPATRRVRFSTKILIAPLRPAPLLAKTLATLDVLSNGRMILGVGIGWLAEEFAAVGVPFASRAERTDESIEALRGLWGPGASAHAGRHYAWPEVESNPKPVQARLPIVIGGHTKGAARRAARLGDGFFPARPDTLGECMAELAAECARVGRDPSEIEITTGCPPKLDEIKRLEDLGVGRITFPPPGFTPDAVKAGLEKLGSEIIARA